MMLECTPVLLLFYYQVQIFLVKAMVYYKYKVCSIVSLWLHALCCFVSVPPPQITLTITSPSNTTTLYEGIPVNLTCTATIDTTLVNTPFTVSRMWIAPNGEQLTSSSSNDRITIVDMLQSAPYTSVLMFDPADDMDTGDYQCNITVVQNNNQPLIIPSSNNATFNLNVSGTEYGIQLCVLYLFDSFLQLFLIQ